MFYKHLLYYFTIIHCDDVTVEHEALNEVTSLHAHLNCMAMLYYLGDFKYRVAELYYSSVSLGKKATIQPVTMHYASHL